MGEQIVVIGLGYVGLPLAVAFGRCIPGTRGFDCSTERIEELKAGYDRNRELTVAELAQANLWVSDSEEVLDGASCYIIAVPTPRGPQGAIGSEDIVSVAKRIGPKLSPNALVILESTVSPGLTEGLLLSTLEASSGRKAGRDFHVAYSPERINPGDRVHTLATVPKVIAAQDEATLARVEALYSQIVLAGCERASSIQAAELSKLLENTQRDVNIALMNEVASLCERLGVPFIDVLRLAGTKWNFLPFTPGLVGGHCISVDPWFLVHAGEQVGLSMSLIRAAREVNDQVAERVSEKVLALLSRQGVVAKGAKVALCGLTFKENVPDLRNTQALVIAENLLQAGVELVLVDPWIGAHEVNSWGAPLVSMETLRDLDALVVAVHHLAFEDAREQLEDALKPQGVLLDLKGVWPAPPHRPAGLYWRL